MPNLNTVEVVNMSMNIRVADLLRFCLCNYTDVRAIMVHEKHQKKWVSLVKKYSGEISVQVLSALN